MSADFSKIEEKFSFIYYATFARRPPYGIRYSAGFTPHGHCSGTGIAPARLYSARTLLRHGHHSGTALLQRGLHSGTGVPLTAATVASASSNRS